MNEDLQTTPPTAMETTSGNHREGQPTKTLPYYRHWTALVPIKLSFYAREDLERLRDHPVTTRTRNSDLAMAELVRKGLAVGEQSVDAKTRVPGYRREWVYRITPAGRAWLENDPVEGE